MDRFHVMQQSHRHFVTVHEMSLLHITIQFSNTINFILPQKSYCTESHVAHLACAERQQWKTANWQVISLQNGTRLVINLEIAVHIGPQGIDAFHTLFQRLFLME